jgi:HEXXH motif-containing protein
VIPAHDIAAADFAALARGLGGPRVIRELWAGQHSKRLLMLRLLIEKWPPAVPGPDEAVAAIAEAEAEAPTAVRELLVDPMVGAWTAATVRRLRRDRSSEADLGHFGAVAAVAALRAGTSAHLRARVHNGYLHLPTIGRLRVPGGDGWVSITTLGGRLRVNDIELDENGHEPRRVLIAEGQPRLTVAMEDMDPYRDAYHVAAIDRVPDPDIDHWRHLVNAGWQILTSQASERAFEIAAGLHCLVPLTKPEAQAARSATSTEAVGVIGLDLPRRPEDLAVALVHEFQHSKLAALLDIRQLYEDSDRWFFAPWRADPRPIGGLLHGVYAFIGVADTWRTLCSDPATFPQAAREFAEARANVSDAVTTLAGSGLLTPAGNQFVAGMTEAVERLQAVDVPAATVAAAELSLRQRRSAWKQQAAQPH